MAKFEVHDFYCINCGQRGIGVPRPLARKREKFHRKDLWCCNCKQMCNHIEITSYEEKEEFMEAYNNGEYKIEATDSISHVRAGGLG